MKNLEGSHDSLDKSEIVDVENIDAEKNEKANTVAIEGELGESGAEVINAEVKIIKGGKESCDKLQTSALYLDNSSLEAKSADHAYLELAGNSKVQIQELNSGQLTVRIEGEAYIDDIKNSNVVIEGKIVVSGDFIDGNLKIKDNASADIGSLEDSLVTIGHNAKVVIGNCRNAKIRISTGATALIRNLSDSLLTIEEGAIVIIENQNDSLVNNNQMVEIASNLLPSESASLSDGEIQKNLEAWQKTMSEAKQAEDELRAEYEQKKSELDEGQESFNEEIDNEYDKLFSDSNKRLLEQLENQTNMPEEEKTKMAGILKQGIKS